MRNLILLSALAVTSTVAVAQDEPAAEEEGPIDGYIYELDELGLKVPLVPQGDWKHDHWSGWDLKATTTDQRVEIIVWTTEFQVDIIESDLPKWGEVFVGKAGERSVKEAALTASSLSPDVHGTTAGVFEVGGKTEDGTPVTMFGATFPIEGYSLHVATLGLDSQKARVMQARDEVLAALEVGKPAKALEWGAETPLPTQVAGKLDPYWRLPLKQERETMMRAIKNLNVPTMKGCWAAIHPQPVAKADMMVVCHNTKHEFPIVDDLTFADQELELREAWVPDAEPSPPWTVQGRTGFWWDMSVGKRKLHVAAVPVEGGLAKIAAMADGGDDAKVMAAAKATVSNNSWPNLAEPAFDQLLRYYFTYRPTSPMVLGPLIAAAVVFLFIMGLIIFGLRRQAAQARAEMEEI